MKRNMINILQAWMEAEQRKPFYLTGIKGVGKGIVGMRRALSTHYFIFLVTRNDAIAKLQARERQAHFTFEVGKVEGCAPRGAKRGERAEGAVHKRHVATSHLKTDAAGIGYLAIAHKNVGHAYVEGMVLRVVHDAVLHREFGSCHVGGINAQAEVASMNVSIGKVVVVTL